MAHYAELNSNNEVINIVYMDNEIIFNKNKEECEYLGIEYLHKHHGSDKKWVRTSYNGNFRGNYASLGDIYREDIDAFIKPQPFSSWKLNIETSQWEPPIPDPSDEINSYYWDENNKNWILITK
jgi:hypothetical protein